MIARVTYAQQQAVLAERAKGRTDRQIEKIVGLPHGILSRRFIVVDDRDPLPRRGASASPRTLHRYTLF